MLTKLNYLWRVLATGYCFASFSLGGALLSTTLFPLIRILPIKKQQKNKLAQTIIHYGFRFFVWQMQFVGLMDITIINPEKLKTENSPLIVANHPCLIDVVLIISIIKKTGCIVKRALWRNPFMMGVVSSAGYISNSDPQELIENCVDYLKKDSSLLIFPEGTRTTPGRPLKFQRGAANIALRAEKDITPVIISCTPPSLTKNQRWYQVPPSGRMNITVRVGDKISITPFLTGDNITLAARKLTDFLENYFQQEAMTNE